MARTCTAQVVTAGHSDKIADQLAEAIVDAYLEQDKKVDVNCHALVSHDLILLTGNICHQGSLSLEKTARSFLSSILNDRSLPFSTDHYTYIEQIGKNSHYNDFFDGKQEAIVSGYACNETAQALPLAFHIAHEISSSISHLRSKDRFSYLGSDGKVQVSLLFDENNEPQEIVSLSITNDHLETVSLETVRRDLCEIALDRIDTQLMRRKTEIFINSLGPIAQGGLFARVGSSGRQVGSDSYGPYTQATSGSFIGKDPFKIERFGSYACRYLAKNIVKAGLARSAKVNASYVEGKNLPVAFNIDIEPLEDTALISNEKLKNVIMDLVDMTPSALVKRFNLQEQKYLPLATANHFGRDNLSWEKLDLVEPLQEAFGRDSCYITDSY